MRSFYLYPGVGDLGGITIANTQDVHPHVHPKVSFVKMITADLARIV